MDMQQIFALMDRFSASPLTGMELELEGARVKLEKGGAVSTTPAAVAPISPVTATVTAPAPAPQTAEAAGSFIKAPLVGTFYAAPAPGEAPFVSVGATVKKGQTVCVLEAMKMMSEVPAPFDCVVEEVLVRDGELAGYDAPLFRVREL